MSQASSQAPSKPSRKAPKRAPRNPRDTPAMRQYYRFKEQHPDCVLFFRMGDFYEMFDDDALVAHRALGITLTERTKGVPMAGVPYHAVEGYLRRMIEQGHRVAVCEQVQDPKDATGVVDRAVSRVLTPGTLIDDALLDEATANTVGAVCFMEAGEESPAVLAMVELSTGAFTLHFLAPGTAGDELARLAPNELLHVETGNGDPPPRVSALARVCGCALTARPAWSFRARDALGILTEHFKVRDLSGYGLADDDPAIAPAGALVRYLQETQGGAVDRVSPVGQVSDLSAEPAADTTSTRLAHLRPPRRIETHDFMVIDATSLRSLEIERTMRSGGVEGTLLTTLQTCRSPMGKRLLRSWLCFPLRDRERIERRHTSVAALIADQPFAEALVNHVARVQDVARIMGRLGMGRATPRDVVALGKSVGEIRGIIDLLDSRTAFCREHDLLVVHADALSPLAERVETECVESPPSHLRAGGLFRDGADRQLDEARGMQRDGNAFLAKYQKELIDQTGINTLKVGYNKVFGYYIEVSHANTAKVPDTFARKQTLKNAERYITPKLKEFEHKITTAEARAIEREQVLFDRLCSEAARHTDALAAYADVVARLDVLACFADHAVRHQYVRPTMVDEPVLDIEAGRHPVLDRLLSGSFVPNDCELGAISGTDDNGGRTLALITGPNMAGKSTAIRQVALITLLAHCGSFVPADRATIGLTDRVFTRIGAHDELHTGQSTFMVEMTETANILHHATANSLVILDEIGRGTSTLDGLALAWSIAESLAAHKCRTLFATHYHELTDLADSFDAVTNLHVAVREWGDEIIFLYRILPGRTDRSYGIHVAKLAGLPPETIARATELLNTLTVETARADLAHTGTTTPVQDSTQMSLFTEYLPHPVLDRLREVKLATLSPLEAFDQLRVLKQTIDGGGENMGEE